MVEGVGADFERVSSRRVVVIVVGVTIISIAVVEKSYVWFFKYTAHFYVYVKLTLVMFCK